MENLLCCCDFVILFSIPGNATFLKSYLATEGKNTTNIKKQERNQLENWLYRLYQVDLSKTKYGHLLIMQESPLLDNDGYIGKGPFSFRTQCDNTEIQIGYCPSSALNSKSDSYDSYKLVRVHDEVGKIIFEVENITKVTKGGDSFIKNEISKTIHQSVKEKEREIETLNKTLNESQQEHSDLREQITKSINQLEELKSKEKERMKEFNSLHT